MKYTFRINQTLSVCGSKEFDVAGDYIIDCFREGLGKEYFEKFSIHLDSSHDNSWYHSFIIQINCELSKRQVGKIDFNLFEAGLKYEKAD
ncbi:MAG: hypothetical protein GQ574_14065 [Crocinitomix sp.]|nr:hypothetical protein [Crocinitomix sp.]